jgi:hypothetical protein
MSENPYTSPLATAKPPIENARRTLAFWLIFMGGWMLSYLALMIYAMCKFGFDTMLAIDEIFPISYAIGSFWIALRVRHGHGIKATRYLLFAMFPFVAGELATPIFVIAKGIAIPSLSLIVFIPMFGHIYAYASAWRWVIRLAREANSQPAP